jgi:hypothetical protein
VAPGAGFKRCCLRTGKYDDSNRDYFFPRVAKRLAYGAKSKGFGPCISFRLTRLPGKWIISGCAVVRLQSATSAKGASDFPPGILSEANFAGRFAA